MTKKNEAASVAQGLDVAEIAKAAWDEAWRIAFSEGMSAGHPLGRSYLDCDTEWADSEVVARLAQAAPPAAPVQDAGLKAAADFIQRKADDYAREFGSGDMGSLSFGNDAMRDYHWGLLELADEIRALAAPAAPAAGESGADLRPTDDELWDQTLIERDRYHEIADDLAAQIAAITGVEIGEHSSANDPWQNAMLAADDFLAAQLRKLLAPPAAEAASQPGEMGAEVPESTNQGEQKCQSKLNVMLLRSVAPVTQDNTSLGDVSRSTSIGAANSMVGSAIRTGDGEAQNYRTADGMPTERAVLEREWRKMRDQLAALPAASAQQDDPICVTGETRSQLAKRLIAEVVAESAQQDEREAFEAWAGGWFFGGVVRCGEGYAINNINSAWYSWKARAAQQVQAGGEDKQDAERYRWLQFSGYSEIYLHNQPGIDNCKEIGGDALDAAIDAALSREQPQPSNGDREGGAV